MTIRLVPAVLLLACLAAPRVLAGTLQVSPSPYDFGNVAVSAGAVVGGVTITNSGTNTTITGFVGAGCTEFSATPATPLPVILANGQSLNVILTYDPSNRTADACTFTVQDNNGATDVIQATGDGIAPALSVVPTQVMFTDQPWASTTHETRSVTVENVGDQAFGSSNLGVTFQIGVNFALGATQGSFPVESGGTITVPVTFDPVSVGVKNDNLVVSLNNDSPGDGNWIISLSGIGTESVGVEDSGPARAAAVGLRPTPSRGSLTVEYAAPASGPVELEVVDLSGRIVARMRSMATSAGTGVFQCRAGQDWSPATGLYLVRVMHGGRVLGTARAVVVR